MSPRTQQQLEIIREEKVERIEEAALGLFASKGYEGTSISQIATQAGISKGLVYNYFSSKEDILKSLVFKVFETVWERLGFEDMEEMGDEEYIRFLNLSVDLVLEDIDHYKLYFAIFTQPQVLSMLYDELMEMSAPYLKMMYDYYESKGYKNPAVQMRYVSAVLDGIQMHIMLDPENFPVEEIKEILIKQFTQHV